MKNLPISAKITIWFTAALLAVALFAYMAVLYGSNRVIDAQLQSSLAYVVESNVDEIEYFQALGGDDGMMDDEDLYIPYGAGWLEVDDDYLDRVNGVSTGLYTAGGALVYGEDPARAGSGGLAFEDGALRAVKADGVKYYVYDRALTGKGLEGLWLRGAVPVKQGAAQTTDIARISLIFLPLLLVAASLGGYWIARRMLRPVQQISQTAAQIGQGGDLKKRIELDGGGHDELHALADSFNQMFQRLDEAFETERQFTADASHELRTPMTVINAQCELTLEKPRTGEEYENALRVIQRQGRKMSRLIGDMLDFTRLETRADSYQKSDVDMTELVSSLCGDMALIREQGITLTCQAQEDMRCRGNRELLARLLTNLIGNAYRYGKEGGHILVRLEKSGGSVRLSVTDDGIGIAPEEQEKIFRRFYQADQSRSGTGTGLGLSMAWEIARFHDGRLRVESQPGQGSVFTLELPGG